MTSFDLLYVSIAFAFILTMVGLVALIGDRNRDSRR